MGFSSIFVIHKISAFYIFCYLTIFHEINVADCQLCYLINNSTHCDCLLKSDFSRSTLFEGDVGSQHSELCYIKQLKKTNIVKKYDQIKLFHDISPRPLNYIQQNAVFDLLMHQNITEHDFDISNIVRLTQRQDIASLSYQQWHQMQDWRQKEGVILPINSCPDKVMCDECTSDILQKIGVYMPFFPPFREYRYTILPGGSIQEMQFRIIALLAVLSIHGKKEGFSLGKIWGITCDRNIPSSEYEQYEDMTFLSIVKIKGSAIVKTGLNSEEPLTETSALKGIFYSLILFCNDTEFYENNKFTETGYHLSQPISFKSDDSFESILYESVDGGFLLNEKFREASCDFTKKYYETHLDFHETRQRKLGNVIIKRPTTKETIKTWLIDMGKSICKGTEECYFMMISNAPHIMYQHIAILQGLEEYALSQNKSWSLITGGPAASLKIPVAYALDDLTKLLYLEDKHPPR